jgi:hypothetical protein
MTGTGVDDGKDISVGVNDSGSLALNSQYPRSCPWMACVARSGSAKLVWENWDVDDSNERADGIESSSLLTTRKHSVVV